MMIGTLMPAICPAEPAIGDREAEPMSLACDPAAFVALMNGCLATPSAEPVAPATRLATDTPHVASVQAALPATAQAASPALHPAKDHQTVLAPQTTHLPAHRVPLRPPVPSPVRPTAFPVEDDLALPQQANEAEPLPKVSLTDTPVMPRTEAGPVGRAAPSTARPAAAPIGDAPRIPQEPVAAAPTERTQPVAIPARAAAETLPPTKAAPIAAPEPGMTPAPRPAIIAPSTVQTGEPAQESAAPAVQVASPKVALQPGQVAVVRQTVQAPRVDEQSAGEPRTPVQSVAGPPATQAVAEAVQRPSRPNDPPPLPPAAEPVDPGLPAIGEPPALEPERVNAVEPSLPPHEAQLTDPPSERGASEPAVEGAETLLGGAPSPDTSAASQHTEIDRPALARDPQGPAVTIRGPLRPQASEQHMDAPQRLVVEVDPPELGRCELELSLREGRVRAVLVAERPETVAALRSVEGQVREQLAARELQVAEFDVRHGPGQEQRQGMHGDQHRQHSPPGTATGPRMILQDDPPISRPIAGLPRGAGLVDVVA